MGVLYNEVPKWIFVVSDSFIIFEPCKESVIKALCMEVIIILQFVKSLVKKSSVSFHLLTFMVWAQIIMAKLGQYQPAVDPCVARSSACECEIG